MITDGWYLDPIFDSYLLVAAILIALFGLLAVVPNFRQLSPRRRSILIGLRVAVVAAVALLLIRPSYIKTAQNPLDATLVIMADQSRSMGVRDVAGDAVSGNRSRWESMREALQKIAPLLDNLPAHISVEAYGFSDTLQPLKLKNGRADLDEVPEGKLTDIHGALDAVTRRFEGGRRLAGVLLLSDGAQRSPKTKLRGSPGRQIAGKEAPLLAVPFGQRREKSQARNIVVVGVRAKELVYVKNEVDVISQVRSQGFLKEIPVELIVEDAAGKKQVVARKTLNFTDNDQLLDVKFTYVPQVAGNYTLRVHAAEQTGELTDIDNEMVAYLDVRGEGLRVLYLEGELRPEQKFIRRALDSAEGLSVSFRWIDPRLREQWPVDLDKEFKIGLDGKAGPFDYDVVILGDLDARALRGTRTRDGKSVEVDYIKLLAEAVTEQNKGLMMLGGYHSFGPGGYGDSPLADVLPILLSTKTQSFDGPIDQSFHVPGPLPMLPVGNAPMMRLAADGTNLERWQKLAPLTGANRVEALKPRAVVFANAAQAGSPDKVPLLIGMELGGRVLAFMGDSTWQWWLRGFQDDHKRFWRQSVMWLAKRDKTKDSVWVKMDQRQFDPQDEIILQAGMKTDDGPSPADTKFTGTILLPSGKPLLEEGRPKTIGFTRVGETIEGRVEAPLAAGEYLIEVAGQRPGSPEAKAQAKFVVIAADPDPEMSNTSAEPDNLATLADETRRYGGMLVPAADLPGVLKKLLEQPAKMGSPEPDLWRLADRWWEAQIILLAIALLLGLEWFFRKRWGLV